MNSIRKVFDCQGTAFIFVAVFLALSPAYGARAFIQQSAVYQAKDNGYFSHRIPALLVTSKGTLLAFCEARSGSASPDRRGAKAQP